MAGSATITGRQNYVLGIGHPKNSSLSEESPVTDAHGVFNYKPSSYLKTRKLVASIRSGFSGATLPVICVGDSTTEGAYGGALSNGKSLSWVRRLADQLTTSGVRAGWQNVMGNCRTDVQSGSISDIDSRVTALPAGWSLVNTIGLSRQGIGGFGWVNSTTLNPITFTPTVQTDSLDVYYLDGSTYDAITVLSGAAGATTPTTGGTIANGGTLKLKKATATYTLGSNVWTIQKTALNSKNIIIQGFSAYNSAQPEISLLNCGCGSQQAAAFAQNANWWESLRQITESGTGLVPPLAIINLGINNWGQSSGVSVYKADMEKIVSGYQAAGVECLICVPLTSRNTLAPYDVQAQYQDAAIEIARNYDCAYIDYSNRIGSYDAAQSVGYYADNVVHPTPYGYADMALPLANFFTLL